MAGVYIKGMEKPKECRDCPFNIEICTAKVAVFGKEPLHDPGEGWCPLVEVPDHGDLIDRDALIESFHVSRELCMKWANEVEGHDKESFLRAEQTHATFVEAILRTKAQEAIIPADKEVV